jgi:hypothetical protein
MSSIVIRNIVGTGAFSVPTTQDDLETLNDSIKDIVNNIPNFRCLSARGDMLSVDGEVAEVLAIIGTFTYNGSVVPDTSALRTAITNGFLADPDITSIGDMEVKLVREGGFYNQYPEIERVDDTNAIVYFTQEAPLGAQIEVMKYTQHYTGAHPHQDPLGPYTSRLGKRYRPDRLLPLGATSVDLSAEGRQHRRCHFRFAYRWPVPDNSGGPGVRGPLGTTTISTAVPRERLQLVRLIINPAPSGFSKYDA